MPNPKKKEIVEKLKELLETSQAVFLVDYSNLSANQLNDLRYKLKEAQARFMVIKNRLLKLALNQSQKDIYQQLKDNKVFKGPLGIIFSKGDDEVIPLKIIDNFKKELNLDKPAWKLGFNKKQLFDSQDLDTITKLPDKNTLQAQVVSALNSPLYGLVNSLSWKLKELVWTLENIKKVKSQN